MPPLSLLIKPASAACNLRCRYCFYHSVAESRNVKNYGIMSYDTLETIVKKSFEFAEHACTFAFQGGEPTLAGLDFFKHLILLQKKYNINKIKVNNAIQTNGIVIDDSWAKFLSDNKFLVGLSLDGPKDIHDQMRIDVKNKGTFTRIMDTVEIFNKYKVEYNILFVVNSYVARHVSKIYNFFKKNKFVYLQFIPCLDPLDEAPGGYEYSLTPDRYEYFLKTLFDLWYEDIINGNMISIRYFDNLVGMLMGYMPEACGMMGVCNCQFVIEADGGVYPCDFYVIDKWKLGSIIDKDLSEMRYSKTAEEFIEESKYSDPKCSECKWYSLCRGGCKRHREPFVDDKPSLNYFCEAEKAFFEYSIKRLEQIAKMLEQRQRR